jgi:hypothetical protein
VGCGVFGVYYRKIDAQREDVSLFWHSSIFSSAGSEFAFRLHFAFDRGSLLNDFSKCRTHAKYRCLQWPHFQSLPGIADLPRCVNPVNCAVSEHYVYFGPARKTDSTRRTKLDFQEAPLEHGPEIKPLPPRFFLCCERGRRA